MNNKIHLFKSGAAGCVLGAILLATAAGCVGYVRGPGVAVVAEPGPVVFVDQDDYVYYPGYNVYYSNHRHEYAYQEGRSWVSRPAPRGVSVNVLMASPSVRMDFHDSPENHHAAVVRQYPRNWQPSGGNHNRDERH